MTTEDKMKRTRNLPLANTDINKSNKRRNENQNGSRHIFLPVKLVSHHSRTYFSICLHNVSNPF